MELASKMRQYNNNDKVRVRYDMADMRIVYVYDKYEENTLKHIQMKAIYKESVCALLSN